MYECACVNAYTHKSGMVDSYTVCVCVCVCMCVCVLSYSEERW